MVYQDPFAKELQPPVVPPTIQGVAPVVAPPVSPQVAPTAPLAPITDTRTLISQTPQKGFIKGFDTRNNFAPVYVPQGKYVAGISATNNNLTTDKLSSVSGYVLPNGQPGTQAQADQAMAQAKAYSDAQTKIASDKLAANPPPTAEANQMQTILQGLVNEATQGTSALTERQTALNGSGIADLSSQQKIADQQLGEVMAQSDALDASYQTANEQAKQGVFDPRIIQGKQQQNYRQYVLAKNELATKANVLRATSLGLQGRIADAKQTIKDAFDAKVEIINSETKSWEAQANAIRPTLDKQEAARLEEVKAQKAKELQDSKDLSSAQTKAISDLYDAGVAVDTNTALAIKNAKTAGDVQNLLTKFAPQLSLSSKLDLEQKQLNFVKTRSEINKNNKATGLGGIEISPITQSIIDNPSLFKGLTPTVQGQILTELQANSYDTTNLGTKPLSDTAIAKISDFNIGVVGLQDLLATIKGKSDQLGPITGLKALNPWSDARKLQSNVDLIRQRVGKALEGGVLRKEDEEKYKKILATLTDTPSTAEYKVEALISTLQRDVDSYIALQQTSGRSTDVNAPLTKKGSTTGQEDLRKKYNY